MKYHTLLCTCIATSGILLTGSLEAAEEFSAKTYAGADGVLSREEAAIYCCLRDNKGIRPLVASGGVKLDPSALLKAKDIQFALDDLRPISADGEGGSWTWKAIDDRDKNLSKAEKEAAIPGWQKITGLTKAKEISAAPTEATLGPIQLRKTADELAKDLKDSKGATVGFADNRLLDGDGAWNTEGILYYPIWYARQGDPGESFEVKFGPSAAWKIAETEDVGGKDIEELTLSLPGIMYISPGAEYSSLWVAQGMPYFQTDFSGGHEIYGLELNAEYVGLVFGSDLYLGGYQNFSEGSSWQYQLRLVPKLDYSATEEAGVHTSRTEGDDWLRIGGMVSLDLRIGSDASSFVVGAAYQCMETLDGDGGYSDLFKAYATWWLSPNAGLTLEYANGETPVADKEIDMLTLGLELKL